MKKTQGKWTTEEDNYLREHLATQPVVEIAENLGRSIGSVYFRVHYCDMKAALGIRKSQTWSRAELNWLRQNFPNTPNRDIAAYLGRTMDSIQAKARKMRLGKSLDYYQKLAWEGIPSWRKGP